MAEPSILETVAPGVIGALLAALRGEKHWAQRVMGFAVGFAIAFYGTVPVMDFFKLNSLTYGGGIGFALGYFGLALTDGILSSDWAAIIKAKLS